MAVGPTGAAQSGPQRKTHCGLDLVAGGSSGHHLQRVAPDLPKQPDQGPALTGGQGVAQRMRLRGVGEHRRDRVEQAQARFRLSQLDAMDQIAALEGAVRLYRERTGTQPRSWLDLFRAGYLRGMPVDPERHPYQLGPDDGRVTLDPKSPLNPLPAPEQPR